MPTPELKIGVYFTPTELRRVIDTLDSAKVEDVELRSQLQKILKDALKTNDARDYQKEPADPKKDYMEKIQQNPSDTPMLDQIGPPKSPNVIKQMEKEYPETMELFDAINDAQYKLFAMKQADYGPGNIAMNGNNDLAVLGLGVRMNDKTQRILHLTQKLQSPNNESLLDSFKDISIYGIIGQIVLEGKWGK